MIQFADTRDVGEVRDDVASGAELFAGSARNEELSRGSLNCTRHSSSDFFGDA